MKTELKSLPECIEGSEAFKRFDDEVKFLLSVPHAKVARRVRVERKRSLKNPNRRGPKPKIKPST